MNAVLSECEQRWRRSDSLELGASPGAVSAARLHVKAILAEWRLGGLADDCESVTAELVANAIEAHQREHLDEPVRLALLADSNSALIVVRDASDHPPVRHEPDFEAESGRGLLVVEAISAWWDWKPLRPSGKIVRALIAGAGPV